MSVPSITFIARLLEPFQALRSPIFTRLYLAQTVSLLGDAFTWVGLALLSYQFGRERSAVILSTALTLRVSAFILLSPIAGVLADRLDRKKILYITHFIRMGIVGCLPFITAEWQIYSLVFLLNVFNAFFTPTYKAIIPQVVDKIYYREAIGLSTATFQLLGVLGPGLAGILAVWLGTREIFLVDAASFIVAGLLILTLPETLLNQPPARPETSTTRQSGWADVLTGTRLLFGNSFIRFALAIEFVSAIAGAQILVNTVGHVKAGLGLSDTYYGWVMGAFGIGATLAAFGSSFDKTPSRRISLLSGALLLGLAIMGANYVVYPVLLGLWVLAGLGQSLAEIPSETLIGEQIEGHQQGRVFGAHFAFSHLWWAVAYPIAGFTGTQFPEQNFLYGGLLTIALLVVALLLVRAKK